MSLHGHIGDDVSALVDGQVPPARAERMWGHVLICAGCRELVRHEGWIKRRLAGLDAAPFTELDVVSMARAWTTVEQVEARARRRRTAIAMVGAGSLGAAIAAMVTVLAPMAGPDERPGPAFTRPAPEGPTASFPGLPVDQRGVVPASLR